MKQTADFTILLARSKNEKCQIDKGSGSSTIGQALDRDCATCYWDKETWSVMLQPLTSRQMLPNQA